VVATVPGVDHHPGPTSPDRTAVTVVVVTWQGAHLLPPCLDSLRAQTVPHRVVVVDNASTDGTTELLAGRPDVQVVRADRNLGFAGGVQLGIDTADTEFVALLNNDAVADPEWLAELLAAARAHPEAAAVTSLLLLAGAEPPVVNNAGVLLLDSWYGADRGAGAVPADVGGPCEVFGFSGGAALLRTAAVRAVGGFATEFFLYYEDTELSWRLRDAGWTIRYQPTAVVVHEHSATTDQRSRSFAYYNERNRLWTLLRRAPGRVALGAALRFALTTVSLVLRPAAPVDGVVPWNMRPGVRLSVARDVVRYLPAAARSRRRERSWRPRRPARPGTP
jgi:GT2 family glycosyltransferase